MVFLHGNEQSSPWGILGITFPRGLVFSRRLGLGREMWSCTSTDEGCRVANASLGVALMLLVQFVLLGWYNVGLLIV